MSYDPDFDPFLDQPLAAVAEVHLEALYKATSFEMAEHFPVAYLASPARAPQAIASALKRLQQLLTPEQYAGIPRELRRQLEGDRLATRRRRREQSRREAAERAEQEERDRQRAAIEERMRAERLAREAEDRRRVEEAARLEEARVAAVRRREEAYAARLAPLLGRRPYAITQAHLDEIAPRSEQRVLHDRARVFVREWFAARAQRLGGPLALPDDAQLDVAKHIEGHLLVRARAGSGKTRSLTYRTMFLQEEIGVLPDAVLLLAFNRKAAAEIAARLEQMGCAPPHVMTFHALGVAIERPDAELVTDDEDDQGFSRLREKLGGIVGGMEREPAWASRLCRLMLELSRPTTIDLGYFANFSWSALDGTRVEGFLHKLVLDVLIEHGVAPNYRPLLRTRGGRIARPIVAFEHAGATVVLELADDPPEPQAALTTGEIAGARVVRLPAIGPHGTYEEVVARWIGALRDHGVVLVRLGPDRLWQRVSAHLRPEFVRLATTYVMRMRNSGRETADRRDWVAGYEPQSPVEGRFLEVAEEVTCHYEDGIAAGRYTDFQEVLLNACRRIEGGQRIWGRKGREGDIRALRHVMVDEFQDVSPLFMRLIQSIRAANPGISVMGVGDDWQAINGFAGATTEHFLDFPDRFQGAATVELPTNYRSTAAVVHASNAIMQGQGTPARARQGGGADSEGSDGDFELLLADRAAFSPSTEEKEAPGGAYLAALRRLVAPEAARGRSVVLLSRIRDPIPGLGDKWIEACVSDLPPDSAARVTGSTIHRFKGKEADVAILVDATRRRYPTISPSWDLYRIFGDTLETLREAERRVLYVGATRPARRLYVVVHSYANKGELSPLFGDAAAEFSEIDWNDFPPVSADGRAWCSVVVTSLQSASDDGGTFPIKELLKAAGFTYGSKPVPQWTRSLVLPEAGVDDLVTSLSAEEWSREGSRLVVEIRQGRGVTLGSFIVTLGDWIRFDQRSGSGRSATTDARRPRTGAQAGAQVRREGPRAPQFRDARVAGVTFPNADGTSRQLLIAAYCRPGAPATLARERGNRHDPNAVAVLIRRESGTEVQIGYIPAELSREVAAALDRNVRIDARITEVTGGGDYHWGVGLMLAIHRDYEPLPF